MKKMATFLGNNFPEVNVGVEPSNDKVQALRDYQENRVTSQESHPWLPTKYTTLCMEPILFSELPRYNRQVDISGQTMDTATCHALLTTPFGALPSPHVSEFATPQFHPIPHVPKSTLSQSPDVPKSTWSPIHTSRLHKSPILHFLKPWLKGFASRRKLTQVENLCLLHMR